LRVESKKGFAPERLARDALETQAAGVPGRAMRHPISSALRNIEASVFQGIPKGIEVLENAGIAASAVHFLVFLRCVHPARHPARLICFASAWRRSSTSATR